MKTFVVRVDTAREQRDRRLSKEKPILTVNRPRCCKLPSHGARASTANQQSRSGAMLSSGVGGDQKRAGGAHRSQEVTCSTQMAQVTMSSD